MRRCQIKVQFECALKTKFLGLLLIRAPRILGFQDPWILEPKVNFRQTNYFFKCFFSDWVVLYDLKPCCRSRDFHCAGLDTPHAYI